MCQNHTRASRHTEDSSLLDLVLTDEEKKINEIEHHIPLGKFDHDVFIFDYNIRLYVNNNPRITFKLIFCA